MLLDQYRRGADKHSDQHVYGPEPRLKGRAVKAGYYNHNRSVCMDTGQDVGVGIGGLDKADHVGKQVFLCKGGRAQVLPIGYNDEKNHACTKTYGDGFHISPEAIRIAEGKEYPREDHIGEPKIICEHKGWAEGDCVIQSGPIGYPIGRISGDVVLY